MEYRLYERTYRCGGYSNYSGHCGADDCEDCNPGCGGTLTTKRDLTDCGYDFNPEEQEWSKTVRSSIHVARKSGAKHGFEAGTKYRKTTTRCICDATGECYHFHHFRIL